MAPGPDRSRNARRRAWGLAGLAALAGCAAPGIEEIDALARSTGARTILIEEDVSLYSPYDPVRSRLFLDEIRAQRAAVFGLFGLPPGEPVVACLVLNAGLFVDATLEGDQLRVQRFSMEPVDGVLGRARHDQFSLEVDKPQALRRPDGVEVQGFLDVGMYTDTIRHELTHIATTRLGVRGAPWLREGIAHAVEWVPIRAESLDLDPLPEVLRFARDLPHGPADFEALLAWQQSFPPTEHDTDARLLAISFLTFLLTREPELPLREAFARVAALDAAALRARYPAWCAWLEALPAPAAAD